MRLTSKLLGWLSRAFSLDPDAYLGLRIRCSGSMSWTVYDGILTTDISGATSAPLRIDLSQHTISSLAAFISVQPGYSVPFVTSPDLSGASALRLLEGTGNQGESNGDHLYVYTSPLYAHTDAVAVELAAAEDAIAALPAELSTTTADGGWLDYLGSFYGVPRLPAEMDEAYSTRIVTEVLRPLGNNLAIEQAIADYTGQQVTITDVVEFNAPQPRFDGTPKFDGEYQFLPSDQPIYGLFDAAIGYDLLGGDPPATETIRLTGIINRMRDAGTQLRALTLGGSELLDTTPAVPGDDQDALTISTRRRFDGLFAFDGSTTFSGSVLEVGTLAGTSPATQPVLTGTVAIGAGEIVIPDGFGGTMTLGVPYSQ